jgi:hypothetical protein
MPNGKKNAKQLCGFIARKGIVHHLHYNHLRSSAFQSKRAYFITRRIAADGKPRAGNYEDILEILKIMYI